MTTKIEFVDSSSETELENGLTDDQKPKAHSVFYSRKNGTPARRLRPIVYQVYLCCKCAEDSEEDVTKNIPDSKSEENVKITGAWSADIFRPPQDTTSQHKRGAYSVTALETADDHIQIRLAALKEVFKWITADVEQSRWSSISVSLVSSDVFLVNLLQEWLPRWHKQNYKIGKSGEYERPNAVALREIGEIVTRLKLTASWQVDTSHEMMAAHENVCRALARPITPATSISGSNDV